MRYLLIVAVSATCLFGQSPVVGAGNFDHIVANMERAFAFYHDVIGLESPAGAQPFGDKPEIMHLSNTIGGQNRIGVFRVPGGAPGVELIEYKDVERLAVHPRIQDPGAAKLILRVKSFSGDGVVQDPDGFFVERVRSDTPGAEFETTVLDTEKTVKFYHDLLGFDLQTTDSPKFRKTSGQVPGSMLRVTFTEYKESDRKPLHTRMQDPGTALLQLRVKDVDALLKTLKATGTDIISAGGEPVTRGNLRLLIVRDPNNLFLEFFSSANAAN